MPMRIRVPLCPWCDVEMKWLLNETDFETHEDLCRQCNNRVVIVGEVTLTITAERYEHPKPNLISIPMPDKEQGNAS